jgi:AcrR family transcriptional regulator
VSDPGKRDRIIEALLSLAAERPWSAVTLEAVAERAGVSLAELRARYDTRLSILGDYLRHTDERVLSEIDPALAAEGPRERLFDVLFARLEAHKPHRAALKAILKSARGDPLFTLQLSALAATSMAWMLTAAGISTSGARGAIKAQALAVLWARVLRVFLDDDDPDLARSMAELDKRLKEAEQAKVRLDRFGTIVGLRRRTRAPRSGPDMPAAEAAETPEGHPT